MYEFRILDYKSLGVYVKVCEAQVLLSGKNNGHTSFDKMIIISQWPYSFCVRR